MSERQVYRIKKREQAKEHQNQHGGSDQQLAIAQDRYLLRLPIPLIAKKRKCTLYRVRTVLSELATLAEATSFRPVGWQPPKVDGRSPSLAPDGA